ncbi:serine hydrolase [Streptomyces sp. NPDC003278]|uniref:serine hydrolase n=1 Tax=Streptomyces sp. NPDC003278 TaxID=3364679 RepID=UPI003694E507
MIEETIDEVFAAGGCRGSLSVREIDGPRRLSVAGGELAVAASTFKIAVGLEFFCRAAEGDVDPAERVAVSPAEASPGGQGLCITEDPVEISLRDIARLMLTISDNTATDVLIRRVGIERVRARLAGSASPASTCRARSGTSWTPRPAPPGSPAGRRWPRGSVTLGRRRRARRCGGGCWRRRGCGRDGSAA